MPGSRTDRFRRPSRAPPILGDQARSARGHTSTDSPVTSPLDDLQRVQYLESLDSVRSSVATGAGEEESQLADLQVVIEVLMTLALGRSVVIPQSFAVDSRRFLSVAEKVLAARGPLVSGSDRPIRPHYFGAIGSFDDAIRDMVTRTGDPERPFVSSLLPGLAELEPGARTRLAEDLERFLIWAPDDVAHPLSLVRAEFKTLSPVEARPRPSRTLPQRLAGFISTDTPQTDASAMAEVRERLCRAIRRLNPEAPQAFNQRSRLRLGDPWPGDAEGRTALEVVGSEDDLALVTEFVDTLYNQVVVDSIGVGEATFSTAMQLGGELNIARGLAQRAALSERNSKGAGEDRQREVPLFEVTIDATSVGEATPDRVVKLMSTAEEVLVKLMALRERPRRGGSGTPFWASVGRLESQLAAGDRAAIEDALHEHLRLVSKEVRADVDVTSGLTAQMAISAGGSAAATAISSWVVPGPTGLAVGAGAAAVGSLIKHIVSRRAIGGRRLASTLGEFVTVTTRPAS